MGRIIAENKRTGKLYPVDSKAIYRVIYEVVDVLPTENIKTSVIYCIPIIGKENEYDMFLYINGDWVSVGSGSIDLSDYYTKEETAELFSDKMDLAPLNPTAGQIAALPAGQLYGDTVNHKGKVKDGQEFYDTTYINDNYYTKTEINNNFLTGKLRSSAPPRKGPYLSKKLWCDYYDGSLYALLTQNWISDDEYEYEWTLISNVVFSNAAPPTSEKAASPSEVSPYQVGYIWVYGNRDADVFTSLIDVYFCTGSTTRKVGNDIWYNYTWVNLSQKFYTKGEVNALLALKENHSNKVTSLSSSSTDAQYPSAKCVYDMIGDVESLLSQV